jgi:hypothetical protein
MKMTALMTLANLTFLTIFAGCSEVVDTHEEEAARDTAAIASVAGFTYVGTAPDAVTMPENSRGRVLHTVHPYQGKIYYGYGDYTYNTGTATGKGTNVSYYDPATNSFGISLAGYNTEEINTFRTLSDGRLYVPNVDHTYNAPEDFQNTFASDYTGIWASNPGTGAFDVHVYDVTRISATELLTAGSVEGANPAAIIWRSVDNGANWSVAYSVTDRNEIYHDGYERFYWMCQIGSSAYMRAHLGSKTDGSIPPLLKYSGGRFSKVNEHGFPQGSGSLGAGAFEGRAVLSSGDACWFIGMSGAGLYRFDGGSAPFIASTVGYVRATTKGDDGRVYVMGSDGVGVVSSSQILPLWPTSSGQMNGVASIAVVGRTVYAGDDAAQIWKRSF